MFKNKTQGFALIVFLIFICILGLGIYFGYGMYINRYYVTFYDSPKNKYLEVPPFAERTTSPKLELLGECNIRFATIDEQVSSFFSAMASKNGFIFDQKGTEHNSDFEIFIKKDYIIKGQFEGNLLKLTWKPVLIPRLQDKARKLQANR